MFVYFLINYNVAFDRMNIIAMIDVKRRNSGAKQGQI